jgi:type III secretory pathway component EscV
VLDPDLLKDFEQAKADQEAARQKHMALMAKKRKEREKLKHQIAVAFGTFIIGGTVAIGVIILIIKAFT